MQNGIAPNPTHLQPSKEYLRKKMNQPNCRFSHYCMNLERSGLKTSEEKAKEKPLKITTLV